MSCTTATPKPSSAHRRARFLAAVNHPNIVNIINFVQHEGDGYIVMEYVEGTSLRQILQEPRETADTDPLPSTHAIAHVLATLPALGYLHDAGPALCDFKPDNVMKASHSVKLIDLGTVVRAGTSRRRVATPGFQSARNCADGTDGCIGHLHRRAHTCAFVRIRRRVSHHVPLHAAACDRRRCLRQPRLSVSLDPPHASASDPASRFESVAELAGQLAGVQNARWLPPRAANRPRGCQRCSLGSCVDTLTDPIGTAFRSRSLIRTMRGVLLRDHRDGRRRVVDRRAGPRRSRPLGTTHEVRALLETGRPEATRSSCSHWQLTRTATGGGYGSRACTTSLTARRPLQPTCSVSFTSYFLANLRRSSRWESPRSAAASRERPRAGTTSCRARIRRSLPLPWSREVYATMGRPTEAAAAYEQACRIRRAAHHSRRPRRFAFCSRTPHRSTRSPGRPAYRGAAARTGDCGSSAHPPSNSPCG